MKRRDVYLRVLDERSPRPAATGRIERDLQDDIEALLRFLRRTAYPAVAGPQLGIDRRVLAVDLSRAGRSPIVLVDPVVEAVSSETATDLEGCLSLPDLLVPVRRPHQVTVRALARSGQRIRLEAGGLLARILQHKIEHLDGILILDHLPSTLRAAEMERLRGKWPACRWVTRRERLPGTGCRWQPVHGPPVSGPP